MSRTKFAIIDNERVQGLPSAAALPAEETPGWLPDGWSEGEPLPWLVTDEPEPHRNGLVELPADEVADWNSDGPIQPVAVVLRGSFACILRAGSRSRAPTLDGAPHLSLR